MALTRDKTALLRLLIEHCELRKALESAFETMPGDGRFCVRRQEVAEHAARSLGVAVINNDVFARIERAARELGWEPIKNGGRSLFRCVKRRNEDLGSALAESRANRRDPRSGRTSESAQTAG